MEIFSMDVQLRWSDLDPNFHLRHSVYYDWGAMCRMEFLIKKDLTPALMKQLHFGPVVFREECIFKKEIHYGDKVIISLQLINARKDYTRWSIRHEIIKNEETLSAIINIDGAWINTAERKLVVPPQQAVDVFSKMPLSADFNWID